MRLLVAFLGALTAALRGDFAQLDRYEEACRSFTPLMRFLSRAVGVPY